MYPRLELLLIDISCGGRRGSVICDSFQLLMNCPQCPWASHSFVCDLLWKVNFRTGLAMENPVRMEERAGLFSGSSILVDAQKTLLVVTANTVSLSL